MIKHIPYTEKQQAEHFADLLKEISSIFYVSNKYASADDTWNITFGKMTFTDKCLSNIHWKLRQIDEVYTIQDAAGKYFFRVHYWQRDKIIYPRYVALEFRKMMLKKVQDIPIKKKNAKNMPATNQEAMNL